jgi:hypothetical protein
MFYHVSSHFKLNLINLFTNLPYVPFLYLSYLSFDSISAFVIGWVVYDGVEKEHDRLQRKQPGEFDHET